MTSFDFVQFIRTLRTKLGEEGHRPKEIINNIEQAWKDGDKDTVEKNSKELLEKCGSSLSSHKQDLLRKLHEKEGFSKRKKDSLLTKMKSGKNGRRHKKKQMEQNKIENDSDKNDSEGTDTDTTDSIENVQSGSVYEGNNEEMETLTNDINNTPHIALEAMEEHDRPNETEMRVRQIDSEEQSHSILLQRHKDALTRKNEETTILEKQKETLEAKIESLKEQTITLKQEIRNLSDKNEAMEKEKRNFEDNYQSLKSKNEKITAELDAERKEKEVIAETYKNELEKLKEQFSKSDRVNKALRNQTTALEEEKKNMKERLENMNKSMKNTSAELERSKTSLGEIDEKNKELETRNQLLNGEIQRQTSKRKVKDTEIATYINELEKLKEQFSKSDRVNKALRNQTTALEEEKKNMKERFKEMEKSMEEKNAELIRLGDMDEKNKELASRLSAVAGAKLLHNNPNISDLSDQDRPTKLSEKYSELYDNEWTNAFTALENSGWGSEEEIIKCLLELLADCFTECQIKAKEQLDQVKAVLLSPAGVTKQDTNNEKTKDDYTFTELQEKSITDLVKQTADVAHESLFKVILGKHMDLPKKKEVKQYIRGCTELCWKMAVQTPPLYLNIFGWEDGKFTKQFFKEYTKVGRRIAFVVWPPLYLHENGPLLCKGTAQGGD